MALSLRQRSAAAPLALVYAALVLVVLGYHHVCGRLLRRFERSGNRRSERWYRVFNESSVLLFAAIVVLVVVRPF